MNQALTIISTCIKCDSCNLICPENAVINIDNNYSIDQNTCTLCNLCIEVCPEDSIKKINATFSK